MNMDIQELEKWTESEDGSKWLESKKQPLLNNRDNLLSELKTTNGSFSDTKQRLVQTENELSEERAALSKFLIDDELNRLLKNKAVVDALIPTVLQSLKDTHGITIKANGLERTATGKLKNKEGQETETTLTAIVDAWAETADAKQIRLAQNTGGGATGSMMSYRPPTRNDNLSSQQLARMTETEFRQWQQELIKQG